MRYAFAVKALCISVVAGAIGVAVPSTAQAPPASGSREAEQTLLRLENEWARALVRRDATAFQRMLAPGFVYTEDAAVMNRNEVIRAISSGPDRVTWAGNEAMKVYTYGNTAVVTGILKMKGRGKDGPFDRRYRYTDTWLYLNGRWQVIAAQDYLIPK